MTRSAFALAVALFATGASADIIHQAHSGDAFTSLAELYYGDARWADLIASHNRLNQLRAEQDVRIPSASSHSVSEADSWSSLAQQYWSDSALARDLAIFLGRANGPGPKPGETLQIPALVPYPLRNGESLAKLARRFYQDVSFALPLARLNRVRKPELLPVGAEIRVPLLAVARAPETSPSEAVPATPPVAAAPQQPSFASELRLAANAYLDGDFHRALRELRTLQEPVMARGSDLDRSVLLRHLIHVYVAFENQSGTCQTYSSLRQIEPNPTWDRDTTSPKVLRQLSSCKSLALD